jgi:hypothetical protein
MGKFTKINTQNIKAFLFTDKTSIKYYFKERLLG